ncbi:response regulator [Polaribacter sp. SA4-10]|uniref:response regulator n=1 Tax=Polaribacter sp. SA4-10 TaxID=754397 RepID=UPI000B3CCE67|nr:response regulator [Polaribacter sp. SA4-10]ARV05665.1 response regulator [Polaribacter sp. SA4-10]
MIKKIPLIGIIDDDTIYQFILTSIINKNKLAENILSFFDGEKAIQYFVNNKMNSEKIPDILFLDVNMPIMDGWMFIEEYARIKKEMIKKTAIFMLSSSVNPIDIERAGKISEISAYIIKPIKLEEVKRIFDNHEIFS